MSDEIFTLCVRFLPWLSARLGMSYAGINVWIFIVLWPIVTSAMAAGIVPQHLRFRTLTRGLDAEQTVAGKVGKR